MKIKRCARCNQPVEIVNRPPNVIDTAIFPPNLQTVFRAVFDEHCNNCWSLICHRMMHLLLGRLL